MMKDKLSKREDQALFNELRAVLLTQFPNPDRTDCPGTPVLEAIAKKRISMQDPAHGHVGRCSPCFSEFTKIQRVFRRRKILQGIVVAIGATIIVLTAWLVYG